MGFHALFVAFAVSESLNHKVAHVKAMETAAGDPQFFKEFHIVFDSLPNGGNIFCSKVPVVLFMEGRVSAFFYT